MLLSRYDNIVESLLLTVGTTICLWGHLSKRDIIELIGLIFSLGGMFVFLYLMMGILLNGYLPIGQVAFLVLATMGLLFSRAFKIQNDISNNWLKPPAAVLKRIYND